MLSSVKPHDVFTTSNTHCYRQIFEFANDAMLLIDPFLNQIIDANTAACKLLGYEHNELLSINPSALHGHEIPALIVFTQSVLDKGSNWTDELSCRNKQGALVAVDYSAATFESETRKLIVATLRDKKKLQILKKESAANSYMRKGISEWKHIENIFQQFEHENQLILKAAGEGIYGVNADGNTTFVNPAAERMLGWAAEEMVGHNIHDMIHHSKPDGSHYDVIDCPIFAAFKDGDVHTVDDEVFWRKDGSPISVEYTSTPIKDRGNLIGAVVIFRDISQRKETERNLHTALAKVEELRHKLEMENAYLQEEIRSEYNYHEIVGKSAAIQHVIKQIELVAPTDANVLITGESGTGKELIARAIHQNSARNERPLIRVNCAVIPRNLFESEFFGHVKGAFTGAIDDRDGRFELADGGTLFLDEVGEIPLDLQGKLLRVLQEGQFERVGENKTRKVDVRIIAATNRDLKQEVANQEFREDLFYRLNVFPIESVPLRKRLEDIPLLTMHFLKRASHKLNKPDIRLSQGDIARLTAYNWPGNIRELENVIERAVIVSQGGRLELDLPKQETHLINANPNATIMTRSNDSDTIMTRDELRSMEYENIISALKESSGKVFGPGGASELLNIKPTTLASKIKRFGIDKAAFRTSSR